MQEENNNWGIAMEGCGEIITDAISMALCLNSHRDELTYIEIGAGEGKTINQVCRLLSEKKKKFYGYAIDLPDGWSLNKEEFYKNTKEYGDFIYLSLEGSPQALKSFGSESVFAIMIDGDHGKEAVIEDFKESDRIISHGGLIFFHDSGEADQGEDAFERQPKGIQVREAIEELGLLNGNERYAVIADHPGNKELNGRGIFIIQRIG